MSVSSGAWDCDAGVMGVPGVCGDAMQDDPLEDRRWERERPPLLLLPPSLSRRDTAEEGLAVCMLAACTIGTPSNTSTSLAVSVVPLVRVLLAVPAARVTATLRQTWARSPENSATDARSAYLRPYKL